jgi:hypothetical protein
MLDDLGVRLALIEIQTDLDHGDFDYLEGGAATAIKADETVPGATSQNR